MASASLLFYGAVGRVTGSMHLGEHDGLRWAVDCGLIQGTRAAEELNYSEWPVPPSDLDHLIITHAHMDHVGRLPRLVKQGFEGPVHMTKATKELAEVLLRDGAKIQMEDAAFRTKIARRKGRNPFEDPFTEPLYDTPDVQRTLKRILVHRLGDWVDLSERVQIRFHEAGHILGSTHVEMRLGKASKRDVTLCYSGDIGRYNVPLMQDPRPPTQADVVIMESTYGDRGHREEPTADNLAEAINDAHARGGVILIPAFAVARTQQVLWWIAQLERTRRIPQLPVYLDSPMARACTRLYHAYPHLLDPPRQGEPERGAVELPREYHEVITPQQSKALNDRHKPCIIVASSGMLSGGRILHHLRMRAPVRENMLLFTGYQSEGTLGRAILDGRREIRLFKEDLPLRMEVRQVRGMSAHADQSELLRWLGSFRPAPSQVYLVHGDPEAAATLAELIQSRLKLRVEVPPRLRRIPLSKIVDA